MTPTDAQIAAAGRTLAEVLRAECPANAVFVDISRLDAALAAYDATVSPPAPPRLAVYLPSTYLARDVLLRIGKDGSRWIVEAEDGASQLHDVTFDGFTGRVRFATRKAAEQMLAAHGGEVGGRFWAVPSPAVRS